MNKYFSFFFLILLFNTQMLSAKTMQGDTLSIRNFKSGLMLDNFWKYNKTDNLSASAIDFDDSKWFSIDRDENDPDTTSKNYDGIIWFRNSFYIDSTIDDMPLAFRFRTNSACEVFVDGRLIRLFGKVSSNQKEIVSGFTILPVVIPVQSLRTGWHHIAIRTTRFGPNLSFSLLHIKSTHGLINFETKLMSMQEALKEKEDIRLFTIPIFFSGIFIVLSIFHFILFLHYRRNRTNLYYSLLTFVLFLLFFGFYSTMSDTSLETIKNSLMLVIIAIFLVPLFFLGILYEVFYKRLLLMFWILAGSLVALVISAFVLDIEAPTALLLLFYFLGSAIETIRVFIRAWVKKKDGSRIFIFGLFFPLIGIIVLGIVSWILNKGGMHNFSEKISDHSGEFFAYAMLMSVSLSMTIYLARDFARMNRKLQEQLREIKQLFERTVDQDKEKKRILENQNVELEKMVVLRTNEVVKQKSEIELKNRDILDNLHYAKRIQEAILPEIKLIYKAFNESFIIYWPKDIVSGDFYSFSQKDDKVVISVADCTGHGVTGAFMSMIGSSLINQIINERGITKPSEILNNLNSGIAFALKQNENDVNDGMDIALCTLDLNNQKLQYAGANRPMWIFQNGEFKEIKADKMAIGGFRILKDFSFTNHELSIKKGDTIYLFSDGYVDQFGEKTGKKLLSKNFREFLSSIQNLAMREQEKKLIDFFNSWKGNEIQVDDVLLIGIQI